VLGLLLSAGRGPARALKRYGRGSPVASGRRRRAHAPLQTHTLLAMMPERAVAVLRGSPLTTVAALLDVKG
jgi:hypothetical protein